MRSSSTVAASTSTSTGTRSVAGGRGGSPGVAAAHALGVQRRDAQLEPAAAVAARRSERVPARRVEAEHAAAWKRDLDPFGGEVADQRAARADDGELRDAAEQPGAAAGVVQRPEQCSDGRDDEQHERGEGAAEPAPRAASVAPRHGGALGVIARRRSAVEVAGHCVGAKVTPTLRCSRQRCSLTP
jgi:hypothetical protein